MIAKQERMQAKRAYLGPNHGHMATKEMDKSGP